MLWIRGAVYYINYQKTDGTVIKKFVVCLQQGKVVNNSDSFLGVLLTTEHMDRDYPWEVKVSAEEARTPTGARITCSQIHTLPKSCVIEYRYPLSAATMREVDKRLLRALCIAPFPPVNPESSGEA